MGRTCRHPLRCLLISWMRRYVWVLGRACAFSLRLHRRTRGRRRGDTPLFWENVNIGDEIPSVVKGPLTTTDILAWYAASQGALHYGGAHGDVVRYRQRHADYHLNKDTGAKDSAGRGHLEVGTGNDVGMTDAAISLALSDKSTMRWPDSRNSFSNSREPQHG